MIRDREFRLWVSLLFIGWLVATGCSPLGFGEPIVWPKAARLGDTVAMGVDSNYVPSFGPLYERHFLSRENVTIRLTQGSMTLATITPKAVFDGLSALSSLRNQVQPGSSLTVVVFDVPTGLSLTYPANVRAKLLVNGVLASPEISGPITLTGTGGSPITFMPETDPEDMEPRPALRLRGILDETGQDGFSPEWEIAGIEFTLNFPSSVTNPEAFPLTEASRALALTGVENPAGTVKIVLSYPVGFLLIDAATALGEVGEGPLLEIAFVKAPGLGFVAGDFTIRDLKVTDREGALLTPVFSPGTDTTQFFRKIARKNLAE